MLKEFKEFAIKGNVIDLAVGVIIGGAFGKIVTSLVNDVIMPIIGIILGGINFHNLKYVIKPAVGETPESAILYGTFIQNILDFVIIAFCIFVMIKLINAAKKKRTEEPVKEEPAAKPDDVLLLEEIRDLLKSKN